ncbi:DUF4974 domain-containing protein [Chitinophaga sp. SYP-B3965]|uniref:FecR family protein n=1 Tax=Chitinophaga sp. SYP-B3965 TaxID=2663120 RepID=UPI00129A000C|nr:FecR family protein [Chitinophaga sp. SYP-B3965]MRG45039.1 DUF4974 domain-containing protein [Chitinophaga sp. SYP-B3965]
MDQFNQLLQKFINDETLSKEELQRFLQLARAPENEQVVKDGIGQTLDAVTFDDLSTDTDAELQFVKTLQRAGTLKAKRSIWKWAAAASILLVIATGTYLLLPGSPEAQKGATAQTDIQPGKEGAILTLDDGSEVVLDSLGNGLVATQNGTKIVVRNGQLAYDLTNETAKEMAYNVMTTPKGRQTHLTLSDGTQVWLNAASAIRYPTAFKGEKRTVELRGEAYFEVAKDKTLPFIVKVRGGRKVEVLGTRFNVNSYEDEPFINTTLLEGSVKVENLVLKPGQQALINTSIKLIENADTEKAIAWKNGLFNFENASLEEVMRQLARWYDIEVVYEKGIPDIHFLGKLSKDISLTGLIRTLRASGVNFRIEEGRRLIVYP